jgi:hypothetical protein
MTHHTQHYKVELVRKDSDHPLAKYVEDDFMQVVVNKYTGKWYPAKVFFSMVEASEFTVTKSGDV